MECEPSRFLEELPDDGLDWSRLACSRQKNQHRRENVTGKCGTGSDSGNTGV